MSYPDQLINLAKKTSHQEVLKEHRDILESWIAETGDQGQRPDREDELRLVFKGAKGKVESSGFDFLKLKDGKEN